MSQQILRLLVTRKNQAMSCILQDIGQALPRVFPSLSKTTCHIDTFDALVCYSTLVSLHDPCIVLAHETDHNLTKSGSWLLPIKGMANWRRKSVCIRSSWVLYFPCSSGEGTLPEGGWRWDKSREGCG